MKAKSKAQPKFLRYDRGLVGLTLALLLIGTVMVFSASSGMSENRFGSPYLFFRKQLIWDAIGGIILLITMRIDYHRWQKWAVPLMALSAVLLAAVLVVGPVVKGARRWIHLGPITFQPSELAKLSLILWVSSFLDRHRSHIDQLQKGYLPPLIVMGLLCGLILKEPDLGTPLMLSSVCMMLMYMSGAKWKHMLVTFLLATLPLYYELFHVGYRQRRLMAFMHPWANSQGAGYQLTEALMAFGSGGIFGKGIGASQLKQIALPDPHTDFIFPVIGEELGFIGAFGIVLLFVLWGWRGWQIVRRAPDLFGQLLAAGITCWVLLQATINMAVSMGLLPTKGLPMPFVSFGGSSIVITLIAVGILLNISAQAYAQVPTVERRQRAR
jgi:cell division protein FtsW